MLSACSGGGGAASTAPAAVDGPAPTGFTADTVSIQANAPISLNPALGPIGQTATLYTYMAYGTLIFQKQDGSFVPDLAEEWGYEEGSNNQRFSMKLREGVTFASGAPYNAQAVADSILFTKDAGGPQSGLLKNLVSAEAADELTVNLEFSAPTPNLEFVFSQTQGLGAIIGPDGLADPDSLATNSDGAGPFTITSDGVIAGSQYTYAANEKYYNPDAVHFKGAVVKAVTDENAILASLADGSLDMAFPSSMPTIYDTAEASGLSSSAGPFGILSLILADREGEISPLGDEKVRQAISHALDGSQLAALIGGTQGVATDQLSVPGALGYSDAAADAYPFDVDAAKKLLADAGYPDGFTLKVLDAGATDRGGVAGQAVASALDKIGITVELKVENDFAQFIPASFSKEYPAVLVATPLFGDGYYYGVQQALLGFSNPFGSSDAELNKLYEEAALAPTLEDQKPIFDQISERIVDMAWFVPLGVSVQNEIHAAHIAGAQPSTEAAPGVWSPFGPTAELSWWSTK